MSHGRNGILGRRRLRVGAVSRRQYVTVTIGLPDKVGRAEWACSVRITGPGLQVSDAAHGADGLQATQLAFEVARQALEQSGLRLCWGEPNGTARGDSSASTGFLRLVPPFFGPEAAAYAARVEHYIERQGQLALSQAVARHARRQGSKSRAGGRSRSAARAG